jgi:predicted helicase
MNNKKPAQVLHYDLQGKREFKYDFLNEHSISSINWQQLTPDEEYAFFVPKNFDLKSEYELGFKLTDLFKIYSAGIKTKVDNIATDFTKEKLAERVNDIITNKLSFAEIRKKYELSDRTTWEYKPENNLVFDKNKIIGYNYRPFDERVIYYEHKFLSRSRKEVMTNLLNENYALSVVRQSKIENKNINT